MSRIMLAGWKRMATANKLIKQTYPNVNQVRYVVSTTPFERTTEHKTFDSEPMSEVRRKSLLYRSRQRGWLELDLILGTWAENNLDKLTPVELIEYETVVKQENPDLMNWLCEGRELPAELNTSIMHKLIAYTHGNRKAWIRHQNEGNQ